MLSCVVIHSAEALAAERDQISAVLSSEDIDPETVKKIMGCVEVVQKAETNRVNDHAEKTVAGAVCAPEKKESIHELLRKEQADIKVRNAEKSRKKPDVQIVWSQDRVHLSASNIS